MSTTLTAILAARAALALLALAAARRVPALRPVAWMLAALALLAAGALYPVPWFAAGRHVAWPGVLLAGAWWGLRGDEGRGDARRMEHEGGEPGCEQHEHGRDDGRARFVLGHPRILPAAIALGYLVAALLAAALYRPGYGLPAARAARVVAAVGLVVLLARRRPATWAELAAVVPLAGMAVGLVVGVWPLSQAGPEAVAAGWGLARAETWVAMVATASAICLAWRGNRRTIAR